MGLVTAKCAKPNECNDWPMPIVQSMYPMVMWDPMEKLE
jgi:hypothetical protein